MTDALTACVLEDLRRVLQCPPTRTRMLVVLVPDGGPHLQNFKKFGACYGVSEGSTLSRPDGQRISIVNTSAPLPEAPFSLILLGWGLNVLSNPASLRTWLEQCVERL